MSLASRLTSTAASTSPKRLTVSGALLGLVKFAGALALLCVLLGFFVSLLALPAWPLVNYLLGDGSFWRAAAVVGLTQVCLFPCYVILLTTRGVKNGIRGKP
jgi:hypothetical protein